MRIRTCGYLDRFMSRVILVEYRARECLPYERCIIVYLVGIYPSEVLSEVCALAQASSVLMDEVFLRADCVPLCLTPYINYEGVCRGSGSNEVYLRSAW